MTKSGEKAVLMLSCLSMYLFSECVHSLQAPVFFMLCSIISFAYANGFYSVRRGIYFPSSVHSLQTPMVFIPFTIVCILDAQFKSPNGFYSVYKRMYS